MSIEACNMLTLNELKEKIEKLEEKKARLLESEKDLRVKAQVMIVRLACEIAVIREDVESLKKMLA